MVRLRKPEAVKHLPFMRKPRKLPVVLSPEEVSRFLEAGPGLKYKAALSVAYGAGLRACEVVALKAADIDSARMVIRVDLTTKSARPTKLSFARHYDIDTARINRFCSGMVTLAGQPM